MKKTLRFGALVLACTAASTYAQDVSLTAGAGVATHVVSGAYDQLHLIVIGPQGVVSEQWLPASAARNLRVNTQGLADGQYHYRLDFATNTAARAVDAGLPAGRDGRGTSVLAGALPPAMQSGNFVIAAGAVQFPVRPSHGGRQDLPGGKSLPQPKDQVIADDLIVQSSICAGFDCVDGESFGFDTFRMKENNTRIAFQDTSASAGFNTRDWQIIANDSASGGVDHLSFEDITAATRPFSVIGGAPSNALVVNGVGFIGIGTSTPALHVQVTDGNTPATRLEQTGASGYTAQTWDVAGNEANFFVRDVTGGSRLPFRIRPGAPTSSIDIGAIGNVGIGTASPDAKLDVQSNTLLTTPLPAFTITNEEASLPVGTHVRFSVDSVGNVAARGTISQLSSRTAKQNFRPIDGSVLLSKIDALPITTWSYLAASDRHLGPVAEDFHQAFGLGNTDKMIAPADLAGVALAAVKALQDQVQQRDRQIDALERRLAELEARSAR